MTITLELPDELAARLAALPDANAFATALLREALAEVETDAIDEEAVAAIARGIAQMEAGQLLTIEQVSANMEASLAARRRERAAATADTAASVSA